MAILIVCDECRELNNEDRAAEYRITANKVHVYTCFPHTTTVVGQLVDTEAGNITVKRMESRKDA